MVKDEEGWNWSYDLVKHVGNAEKFFKKLER
jgi:hypothetical protein